MNDSSLIEQKINLCIIHNVRLACESIKRSIGQLYDLWIQMTHIFIDPSALNTLSNSSLS